MKHLIFTLLIIAFNVIFAQQSPLLVKAYFNAEFEGDDFSLRPFRTETSGFGRLTLGVNKSFGQKNYAELELSNFTFRRENELNLFDRTGSSRHTHDVGIRFEMGTTFSRKKKHTFQIGLAIKPRFIRIQDRAADAVLRTTREFLFNSSIIPRFNYRLSEAFSLDVNGVLDVFQITHLNEKETGIDAGESYWIPASIGMRAGIVYRI